MGNKYVVFHHDDLDGKASGALMCHELFSRGVSMHDVKCVEVDYPEHFPDVESNVDHVYIVDISFTENNIHELDKFLNNDKLIEFVWIDHHQSSIKALGLEENAKYRDIKGIRYSGYAATLLTHLYLNDMENLLENSEVDVCNHTPYWIQLVDMYDCWKNTSVNVRSFAYGMLVYDLNPMDVLFSDTVWTNLMKDAKNGKYDTLSEIQSKGESIIKYNDAMNDQYMQDAFERTICGIKTLCLNARGNSLVFGDRIQDYDMVCLVRYDGNKFRYSLYSNFRSQAQCGEIAEKFGGGGHMHAAGFSHSTFFGFADDEKE